MSIIIDARTASDGLKIEHIAAVTIKPRPIFWLTVVIEKNLETTMDNAIQNQSSDVF